MSSNNYGYVGVGIPEQKFGSNKGVLSTDDVKNLIDLEKFTHYGQLELISTATASGESAIEFIDFKKDKYTTYLFTLNDVNFSADAQISVRFYLNGVLATASSYQLSYRRGASDSNYSYIKSAGIDYGLMHSQNGGTTSDRECFGGVWFLHMFSDSDTYPVLSHKLSIFDSGGSSSFSYGGVSYLSQQMVTGFQVKPYGSQTIDRGEFALYGYRGDI